MSVCVDCGRWGAHAAECRAPLRKAVSDFQAQLTAMTKRAVEAEADLKAYLADTAVTCAFCEARHERPVTFEDIRAHVGACPKHPLAAALAREAVLREALGDLVDLTEMDDEANKPATDLYMSVEAAKAALCQPSEAVEAFQAHARGMENALRHIASTSDDHDSRLSARMALGAPGEAEDHDARIREAALEEAAKVAEGGRFLHDDAPDARFGKACARAIRALASKESGT